MGWNCLEWVLIFLPVIVVPNSKFYYGNYLVFKQWRLDFCKYKTADTRTIDLNMKRHLTKSVYILACSAGVFFGCANVFDRESAMLKLPKRGVNGASQRERGGGGKREEKITSAQSKHGLSNWTLKSIIYSSDKKRIGTSSILAWSKSGVGFSTASKSCPDASVEIALTFLLRNTRDIPSRSNSKRLASTQELKFEFTSGISEFRIILSRSSVQTKTE